jgi:predicted transcriptional regulator
MQQSIIDSLESLGFTNYESKVFCVLFEGRTMTASEIAKEAKIPRSSAYDVLKSFTQKGICNEIQTTSVALYEIIDPKVVEDKIQKDIHDIYKNRMSKLKDSFEKLQPVFKAKQEAANKRDVELIKGFNKHRDVKFMELWKESNQELLLMNRLEGHIDSSVDEFTVTFIKQGGVIKTLYEVGYNFKLNIEGVWQNVTENTFVEIAGALGGDGGEVKLTGKIFQNMAIFDRKAVYVSLVDPSITKYNRSDVIVRNENYAQAMGEYFDICWQKANTIEEYKRKSNNKD